MSDPLQLRADISRRKVLQTILSGAMVGMATQTGIGLDLPQKGYAQSSLSSDAALHALLAGNRRMVANQRDINRARSDHPRESTPPIQQEPFAAILACADSRVPVELVFDQTIGHLFVTRLAGNVVTAEVIVGLEYGVAVLRIKVLVVLGHSGCGAVKAAMKADAAPGQIMPYTNTFSPGWHDLAATWIRPIEANARIQADLLRTSSPVIRDAIKVGKLKVEAAM